jgi:methyl-accepting chemotaxis protein
VMVGASESLENVSQQLAKGASLTTQQSAAVATATEELSANMRSMAASMEEMSATTKAVATSAEEMTSSTREIARSADEAAAVAGEAATLVKHSYQKIEHLGNDAEAIGKVIMIIQDIAERTNLLALNASIEAARAGDAGRGFAVVATEVKELARQTSMASEDIRSRIQEIQSSAGQAVSSVKQINEVIERVNRVSRTLAAAVEEQSITTNEIARSVGGASEAAEHASSGVAQSSTACGDISRNIGEVDRVARQTAQDAALTKASSEKVSEVTRQLNSLVLQFKI